MSHRWGAARDLTLAAKGLESLPKQFGNWQMRSSEDLSQNVIDMLQCAGYANRVYENPETGDTVSVVVLVGPPKEISVHTPEICYSSRAYSSRGKTEHVKVHAVGGKAPSGDGDSAAKEPEFLALTLRKDGLNAENLRVYYAWNSGRGWVGPESPRWAFAGMPLLYKIQLASLVPPDWNEKQADACQRFLEDFLPVLEEHLHSPAS